MIERGNQFSQSFFNAIRQDFTPDQFGELTDRLSYSWFIDRGLDVELLVKYDGQIAEAVSDIKPLLSQIRVSEKKHGTPEEKILETTTYFVTQLSEDRREKIVGPLFRYLHQTSSYKGYDYYRLLGVINSNIDESRERFRGDAEMAVEPLGKIYEAVKTLVPLFKDASTELPEAQNLVKVLEEHALYPLMRSNFYIHASRYWSYLMEEQESDQNLDSLMTKFISRFSSDTVRNLGLAGHEEETYIQTRLLPRVENYFAEVVRFYPKIRFFNHFNNGQRRYPFLQQVDGVKQLVDLKAGILGDESGIGKTVTSILAGLHIAEEKAKFKDYARILIVGSKTVINNWEKELAIHIDDDDLFVFNLNTPYLYSGQSRRRLEDQASTSARVEAMRSTLEHLSDRHQVYLANYDVFRRKEFQSLLRSYQFDVAIVDEAHRVRQRRSSKIAKRTFSIYEFIRQNPRMAAFFATGTPYVKDINEPLTLASLTHPKLFDKERIRHLRKSSGDAHAALREVMVRRHKKEVADLPPKNISFVPLSLQDLEESEKEGFIKQAIHIANTSEEAGFGYFYRMWNLESQLKLPWLVETTRELLAQGKKIVIFTPYVNEQNSLVSEMSTVAIAYYLKSSGIEKVDILDGKLRLDQREHVQEEFKLPIGRGGIDVLVGNYDIAGEGITLVTPHNRATESILFVCPDTLSKFKQAEDRIHRYGQPYPVTIHVPFVTGDLLQNRHGTFDEQVVSRLFSELGDSESVVDGVVFVETENIYHEVFKKEGFKFKKLTTNGKIGVDARRGQERRSTFFRRTSRPKGYIRGYSIHDLDETQKGEVDTFKNSRSEWGDPIVKLYLKEIYENKSFTSDEASQKELTELILRYKKTKDPENFEEICRRNQRLVFKLAARKVGRGVPFMDLIQEGNKGLISAIKNYDPTRARFSTYATWWIKQGISRALSNQGRTIRVPVHINDAIYRLRGVEMEYLRNNGELPTDEELAELLGITTKKVVNLKKVAVRPLSLDQPINDDDNSAEFGDYLADNTSPNPEEITNQSAIMETLETAVKSLPTIERAILSLRYGFVDGVWHTLEETAEYIARQRGRNITRERVRQLEGQALNRLRHSSHYLKLRSLLDLDN